MSSSETRKNITVLAFGVWLLTPCYSWADCPNADATRAGGVHAANQEYDDLKTRTGTAQKVSIENDYKYSPRLQNITQVSGQNSDPYNEKWTSAYMPMLPQGIGSLAGSILGLNKANDGKGTYEPTADKPFPEETASPCQATQYQQADWNS